MMPRKIAILLSGRGSNFVAIHDAIGRGDLNAGICCVVSNVPDAAGLAKAREFGLNAVSLPSRGIERTEIRPAVAGDAAAIFADARLPSRFHEDPVPRVPREYAGRVMNIHPALLPSFPGLHAQRQALQYGVKVIRLHGSPGGRRCGYGADPPATCRRKFSRATPKRSLSARILKQEHDLYWRAIAMVLKRSTGQSHSPARQASRDGQVTRGKRLLLAL